MEEQEREQASMSTLLMQLFKKDIIIPQDIDPEIAAMPLDEKIIVKEFKAMKIHL